MKKSDPRTIFLKDYSASHYLIEKTKLYFDLRDEHTVVTSTLTIYKNPDVQIQSDTLTLDGADLELLEISVNGEALHESSWDQTETSLTIRGLPERFSLTTRVKIYPHKNTLLEGLYKTGKNYCTQCEAQGFRRITWYLDRPDVMSLFSVEIEAQRAIFPNLLSNGNKSSEEDIGGGRYIVSWEDPFRKPAYLFALVAGDYACMSRQYITQTGRNVALNIYTEAHNIDKTEHAMNSLVNAMRWDEERFGLEYDLDIYNVVATDDFNMGAMENKGLNVFNSKYVLASPETATDADYIGIEGVIGHEYFHNWTGNRVTCRDWFQLSLKEGLTVFRDQEFTADMNSAVTKRIEDANFLRGHQYAEDAGPMAHPIRPPSYIEINNFYTLTVYEKGAQVVRIYQSILGKEGFRKGMDLYFQRHDGEAVTTEDFLAAMADANGQDLSLMQRWYDQAGTPELEVTEHWNEEKKTYRLIFTQHIPKIKDQPTQLAVPIPLALGLLDQDGVDIDLSQHCKQLDDIRVMTTDRLEVLFETLDQKPVVSLLRDFSAPVKIRFDYSDEQLAFLASHDNDLFNRWQACQALATNSLVADIDRLEQGKSVKMNERLYSLFGAILAENNTPQLKADLLLLPGENILAEEMEVIQPDFIHSARMNLKSTIAAQLYRQLMSALSDNSGTAGNTIDPESMGRRKMLSVILDYLLSTGEPDAKASALKCYHESSCMTETMAAMKPLVHTSCEEGKVVLRDFESRWINEPLVMDKWFSLQATVPSDSSLEVVATLMSHSGFSIKNPNRVRAVIGAFANANPTQFHRQDGAGYQFIADQVLELNTINPMIAARLAKSFSHWRQYDHVRQGLMHAQLERIVKVEGLSKDVYEIVSKCLQ